jgi:hypothetical protein
MTEQPLGPSSSASVVLEIGGDVGALVLYVTADLLGAEIDVEPLEPGGTRTHSAVRERQLDSRTLYAAVYPALVAGSYRLGGSAQLVRIVGGFTAEVTYEPDHSHHHDEMHAGYPHHHGDQAGDLLAHH